MKSENKLGQTTESVVPIKQKFENFSKIADTMLEKGHSLQNSVVIGGFRKHSFAAVISQYLVGNSAIYLSPQSKTNFSLVDQVEASIAIIGFGCVTDSVTLL